MLGMRRTLFTVPLHDVPIVQAAASRAVAERERKRTIAMSPRRASPGPRSPAGGARGHRPGGGARAGRGEHGRADRARPATRPEDHDLRGKSYEATISRLPEGVLPPRARRRIGRGRPRGTWIGSQDRWSPIERWLPERDRRDAGRRGPGRARPALAARIRAGRPQTTSSGGPAGRSPRRRQALRRPEPSRSHLDDGAHRLPPPRRPRADRRRPSPGSPCSRRSTRRPWAGPTATGTSMRHRPALFDSAGNGGPTIWVDGRIVGGWAQRRSGEIVADCFSRTLATKRRRRSKRKRGASRSGSGRSASGRAFRRHARSN